LLVSERFAPSVGGVQTVTRVLGEALGAAGHSVRVVTNERGEEQRRGGGLLRCPGMFQLLKEYRTAEAVVLQGPTLRLGWPLMWMSKRAVLVHHIMPGNDSNRLRLWLRERLARRTRHVAVCMTLASTIRWPIEAILPNPYDQKVFHADETSSRDLDVVFAGRLVPEKGAHILIEALSILARGGTSVTASIIGNGPELRRLEESAATQGLKRWVQLRGQATGSRLAKLLNRHRVLAVPSLCAEGFGLVALEGIACGCVVVGSRTGGLPEAIGPCGTTFRTGNAECLADALRRVLGSADMIKRLRAGSDQHLARHCPEAVARRYLCFLSGNVQAEGMVDVGSGGSAAGAEAAPCALS